MQPKNQAERRKAFLNFLFVFLICIAIIITTVFFSTKVPFKQNDQLLKQVNDVERERDFTKKFNTQMVVITNMLDSINTKSDKPELLDGSITTNITQLNNFVQADSVSDKFMYLNIINTLSDLQKAKKDFRNVAGKDANAEDLNKKLNDLQTKYDALQNNYNNVLLSLRKQ